MLLLADRSILEQNEALNNHTFKLCSFSYLIPGKMLKETAYYWGHIIDEETKDKDLGIWQWWIHVQNCTIWSQIMHA